jgi:hypothetical protein
MTDWFIINNIEEFTDKARAIVFNNFGKWDDDSLHDVFNDIVVEENEQKELDSVLSHQESMIIVKQLAKKQRNTKTKDIRYVLDDNIFADIIHNLNNRMVSNILNGLVQKGLVESAFDSDANDFIFWVKNNAKNQDEKPETD